MRYLLLTLLLVVGCGKPASVRTVAKKDFEKRLAQIETLPYYQENLQVTGEIEVHQFADAELRERFKILSTVKEKDAGGSAAEVLVPVRMLAFNPATQQKQWIDGAVGYIYSLDGKPIAGIERHNTEGVLPVGLVLDPWQPLPDVDAKAKPVMVWSKDAVRTTEK